VDLVRRRERDVEFVRVRARLQVQERLHRSGAGEARVITLLRRLREGGVRRAEKK
jgi:predicted N-acetyltransferase YhbS